MRSDVAISVKNLTKTYRIFGHPGDRIKQALTLGRKQYHKEFTALNDVSFEIKKGETVGIIGRNGSGKSTLLQLICGIIKPTLGTVQVKGRVSALLELGAGFNPEFTGRENAYFQGALMGLNQAQMDQRIDEIAAFADIGSFIDQPVRIYSSGMFVRLAFAVMIHMDADILVIDEALSVGDESFQNKCFSIIQELFGKNEKIIIYVSHNTRQIERMCSKALLLESGALVEYGKAAHVCNSYQDRINKDVINKIHPTTTASPNLSQIIIDKVWLKRSDNDDPTAEYHKNENIVVGLNFTSFTTLHDSDVIIEIQSLDRISIIAANTGRSKRPESIIPGTYIIECEFKSVPLFPGIYQIKIIFIDKEWRMICEEEQLCPFRIIPSKEDNLMQTPVALIDIPFEISMKKFHENKL